MIHVIANIELKPGVRDAFLRVFRALVPKVQAEGGCLEYGPALDARTDIRAQLPFREDVVTIVEKWESLAALKAHLAAPHMADYRAAVKDLVVRVTLQILEPV
ncbi:MAG TPA: antibiotic biosynthesis monooxygenase [Planctomycetota bacterium]|nr:antibiotic biosynthesis monooxygenase [Planctomycetota bacterium]HRR78664.1 antibiotic biosynthesis monooxygenase [Planctomycetota bacterium]HRT96983.1 antibiotic biosynthesis monooxygenase [Planctomycetota bacterium]